MPMTALRESAYIHAATEVVWLCYDTPETPMTCTSFCACVATAVVVVAGCDQSSPSRGSRTPAAATTSQPSATATPSESPSGEKRVPVTGGAPVPLDPGTYLSPEGFTPAMSVSVPPGWYGGGSNTGWGIGQGHDEVNQRFRDAGLGVDVIPLRFEDAVDAFQEVEGLDQVKPMSSDIDGHAAMTFRATATGEPVLLLESLGVPIDISGVGRQTFVDVDGTTILIRSEVIAPAAAPILDRVLASVRFPQ